MGTTGAVLKALKLFFSTGLTKYAFEPGHTRRMSNAKAYDKVNQAIADVDAKEWGKLRKRQWADYRASLADTPHPPELPSATPSASPLALLPATAEVLPEEPSLEERGAFREFTVRALHQHNLEQVARGVVDELEGKEAADEPVDVDIAANLMDAAARASSEEAQRLWSKILAGEIMRPGSFSARAISTIRQVSPDEARLFQSLMPYVLDDSFIAREVPTVRALGNVNLPRLEEAGLISLSFILTLEIGARRVVRAREFGVRIENDSGAEHMVQIWALTMTGTALARLVSEPVHHEYLQGFVQQLRERGMKAITQRVSREADGRTLLSGPDVFPEDAPG